jgi:hypothetical protein
MAPLGQRAEARRMLVTQPEPAATGRSLPGAGSPGYGASQPPGRYRDAAREPRTSTLIESMFEITKRYPHRVRFEALWPTVQWRSPTSS